MALKDIWNQRFPYDLHLVVAVMINQDVIERSVHIIFEELMNKTLTLVRLYYYITLSQLA